MEEPVISFRYAALKIQWANELVRNLTEISNAFIQEKPYRVELKPDPEKGWQAFHVGLTRPIPPTIPLLIGDAVGNLRASLDYAWMGLVRSAALSADKRTLPIASDRKGLIATIEKSPIGRSVEKAKTLLGDKIKSHRDFANGGNRSLAALNDLSNWNKHNLLIASIGVTEIRNVTFGDGNFIGSVQVRGGVAAPLRLGPGMTHNFRYEGDPRVEIVFGGHELVKEEPVIPTLLHLGQSTAQSLKAFCEAFPSADNPRFD